MIAANVAAYAHSYQDAYDTRKAALENLTYASVLLGGIWTWSMIDLNRSFHSILPESMSNVSIEINPRGHLQANVKF